MRSISLSSKRIVAFGVWLTGSALFFLLALWHIRGAEMNAENRLLAEAGRDAAQLANMLDTAYRPTDSAYINSIIKGFLEDEQIYAVRVEVSNGVLAGQRRNYLWEPVPWDDEIPENCVQGVSNLRFNGKIIGSVSIWLSPRIYQEETAQIARGEAFRFLCFFILWSFALGLVLLDWGDFQRLGAALGRLKAREREGSKIVPLQQDLSKAASCPERLFDASSGKDYQQKNPDSFYVTAGMFRQTFARGPELIHRLYASGEYASLSHLGKMLEMAAPCIGAASLLRAAREMQASLKNPFAEKGAPQVYECAQILRQVLEAMNGNKQGQTNKSVNGSK